MSSIIKIMRHDGATRYVGQVEVEVTEEDRRQARADGIQDATIAGAFEATTFETLAEASEYPFPDSATAQLVIDAQLPKLQNSRCEVVEVTTGKVVKMVN